MTERASASDEEFLELARTGKRVVATLGAEFHAMSLRGMPGVA